MSPLCIPFLFCCIQDDQDSWVSSVHSVLQQDQRRINIPEEFRQALLSDDVNDFSLFGPSLKDDADTDATFPLKGLPQRPLYVELGNRLHLLHQNIKTPVQQPFLLPAEHFGFAELPDAIPSPLLPRYTTKRSIRKWINSVGVGTRGILRILGMRSTIGTDPHNLLPPSWKSLLEAASFQKNALSVAARARAKHAHRGKDQFFGIVSGNAETQNSEAHQIVLSLLSDAAWINMHTFGGNTLPFLEVRVASGYGARWKLESTQMSACKVSFRGFLEPQMPDGHERNWKH